MRCGKRWWRRCGRIGDAQPTERDANNLFDFYVTRLAGMHRQSPCIPSEVVRYVDVSICLLMPRRVAGGAGTSLDAALVVHAVAGRIAGGAGLAFYRALPLHFVARGLAGRSALRQRQ